MFLYVLKDPRDNIVKYVGITKDPRKRFKSHICDLRAVNRKNNWIKRLKWLNLLPIMEVIADNLSLEEAERQETLLIKSIDGLFNSAVGGKVNKGYKLSEKTKQLMSKTRKGKNNGFYGKTHSKAIRNKLSQLHSIAIKDSNGVIYKSMTDAALTLNIHVSNIWAVIRNKRKSAGGLKFTLA